MKNNLKPIEDVITLGCGCFGVLLALTIKLSLIAALVWFIIYLVKLFW